ncbi:brain-enriched guanylate kinase-associated protein-like [Heptranchias perlo]|uniref:brain-enriched guanylate kinase-associated protein-like n=1 Tax=Heptranchias perlo TaxID=212740 RepID=UPI00355AAAE5
MDHNNWIFPLPLQYPFRPVRDNPHPGTSSSQQQNEQRQKHHLELQQSECDTTCQYLETELQCAHEELKKLTGKLRWIQNNHAALQRVNQNLEHNLHRMAQLHEEEKRNLSHEIITLNNHLMEAKITIDKLTEDNLPTEIQERVRVYMEKFGCGLPGAACHLSYSDTRAKVLEKPEPTSLPGSPIPASLSRQIIHGHSEDTDKLDGRSPCKANLYRSDSALYCPADQRRGRRQIRDRYGRNVVYFRTQSFTDSSTEAEGFSTSLSSESLPNYATSVPGASSCPSCTLTAEKKATTKAKTTLNPTQQVAFIGLRDDVYERKCNTSQEQGNNKSSFVQASPLQQVTDVAHGHQDGTQHCCARTLPAHFSDSLHLSRMSTQFVRVPKLYNDQRNMHAPEKNIMGQCRKVNMHYSNTSSYRVSGKISSSSHTERQLGSSLMKKMNNQVNQFFTTSSREDNFHDGEDNNQSSFAETSFGTMNCQPSSEIDYNNDQKQVSLSTPRHKDTEGDPKAFLGEKSTSQACIKNTNNVANIKKYVDVAPNSSIESLRRQPIKLLVVHNVPLDDGVLNRKQEKSSKISGLYRKDSLTKAQLYGNLLN